MTPERKAELRKKYKPFFPKLDSDFAAINECLDALDTATSLLASKDEQIGRLTEALEQSQDVIERQLGEWVAVDAHAEAMPDNKVDLKEAFDLNIEALSTPPSAPNPDMPEEYPAGTAEKMEMLLKATPPSAGQDNEKPTSEVCGACRGNKVVEGRCCHHCVGTGIEPIEVKK